MHTLTFPLGLFEQPTPGHANWSEGLTWDAPELPWEWGSKWERLELAPPAQSGFAAYGPLMSPHWDLKFREDIHHPSLVGLLQVIKSLVRVLPWERSSIMQALESLQTGPQEWETGSKL